MTFASVTSFFLGSLTVIAGISVLGLALGWFLGGKDSIRSFFKDQGVLIAFFAVLIAVLGSLIYSEILGYEPCKLCWIQRIFLYPQLVVLGFALYGKHKGSYALLDSAFALSILGGIVALYHYLLQLGIIPEGSCAAIGSAVSCAKQFVLAFGFITIPMMSLSAFALIIFSLQLARSRSLLA